MTLATMLQHYNRPLTFLVLGCQLSTSGRFCRLLWVDSGPS